VVKVGVVGTTSWGTMLGVLLAQRGTSVALWSRSEEEAEQLRRDRENRRLLPGTPFPPDLTVSADPGEAFGDAEAIIVAVPSRSLRENLRRIGGNVPRKAVLVSVVKGLERPTGKRMTELMAEELSPASVERFSVLSGPNLSAEIALGYPSSTVVASQNPEVARWVQDLFNSRTFRVYTSDDVVGVELGGALKNVIAIGAGVSDGLGYGENAKAAFVTRGLAEITRLGVASGATPLTLAGLSGLGDLMATCFSELSRNRHVGEQLGRGHALADVRAGMQHVAEGVDTVSAALTLASRYEVEMPITETLSRILFEGMDPQEATTSLLNRAPTQEWPVELARGQRPDA
jgi:glycerol-3-phosphate dehydrogenase (NAD(P)+)